MSELRWHPFLGQWVITATHRQERTFHPPAGYCPLCPTAPGGFATEVPFQDYDIVVFENKFPSLVTPAYESSVQPLESSLVDRNIGVCEVICYSSDHAASMATLPLRQIQKLTRVWRDRFIAISDRQDIEYVFVFENKGKEIGVTLSHPHGQIYAFGYVPPIPEMELKNESAYYASKGRSMMDDWIQEELSLGTRIVAQNECFAAVVPFFARYPYEVHIVNLEGHGSISQMGSRSLDLLAELLHSIARKYDALFGFTMPYIMAMHQKPNLEGYDFTRFHVEFYPPYRTSEKLKFLAGCESGAGSFINDTLPEETAAQLRLL